MAMVPKLTWPVLVSIQFIFGGWHVLGKIALKVNRLAYSFFEQETKDRGADNKSFPPYSTFPRTGARR
jgi:hypothetical protein